MAADASAEHLGMIDLRYRCESDGRMAVFAKARRRDVVEVPTGSGDAVMTARATGIDAEMIEKHREPAGGSMA